MKFTKLTDAIPSSRYDSNEFISPMLANAGRDYYRACCLIRDLLRNDVTAAYFPTVSIPLMPQCIELIAKALVTKADHNAKPKTLGHKILKLMEKYKSVIPVFDSILSNSQKVDLITELEKSYPGMKYWEYAFTYESEDLDLFEEIVTEMMVCYNSISGVEFFRSSAS